MRNVSIAADSNGDKMVLTNEVIFKGKKSINWDDVRVYLESYVGEFYETADTRDIVYIDNDLPGEYASLRCAYSLKGANAKAKANVSQGVPQMLEIVIDKHFRENSGEKRQRNATNGQYQYDSRFALPVYEDNGEVDHYNVFHASILIRHASDGKMYLYNILDIEKETSNPFRS